MNRPLEDRGTDQVMAAAVRLPPIDHVSPPPLPPQRKTNAFSARMAQADFEEGWEGRDSHKLDLLTCQLFPRPDPLRALHYLQLRFGPTCSFFDTDKLLGEYVLTTPDADVRLWITLRASKVSFNPMLRGDLAEAFWNGDSAARNTVQPRIERAILTAVDALHDAVVTGDNDTTFTLQDTAPRRRKSFDPHPSFGSGVPTEWLRDAPGTNRLFALLDVLGLWDRAHPLQELARHARIDRNGQLTTTSFVQVLGHLTGQLEHELEAHAGAPIDARWPGIVSHLQAALSLARGVDQAQAT